MTVRCCAILIILSALAAPPFPTAAHAAKSAGGYGALVPDPAGLVDLPAGFAYKIVARAGEEMADGLVVPASPDGMGAFAGPGGTTIVVCNHENLWPKDGAFGTRLELLGHVETAKIYDLGYGVAPAPGGTTTIVWDTRTQSLVRQYLSLAGTIDNCGGGTTPWGSWLTCEEITHRAGMHENGKVQLQQDHGFIFEVPAGAEPQLAPPIPLTAMGRFTHEAVAVDPRTGIVYETEDLKDGLFYRFIPDARGDLRAGRLQALAFADGRRTTRNWPADSVRVAVGTKLAVKWIDMDHVDSPNDDLRERGHDLGASLFARPEGVCMMDGAVYFTCTAGGKTQIGQIWRYLPGESEGMAGEKGAPGHIELLVETADSTQLLHPDNITAAPWGDLTVCEDPGMTVFARLVGVTRSGATYTFARARVRGEFAGATYSPDGSTLFVNLQQAGFTFAITGPWKKGWR